MIHGAGMIGPTHTHGAMMHGAGMIGPAHGGGTTTTVVIGTTTTTTVIIGVTDFILGIMNGTTTTTTVTGVDGCTLAKILHRSCGNIIDDLTAVAATDDECHVLNY